MPLLRQNPVRVLDWFHIGMRFEQLLLSLRGLRGADAYTKDRLQGDVERNGHMRWTREGANSLL